MRGFCENALPPFTQNSRVARPVEMCSHSLQKLNSYRIRTHRKCEPGLTSPNLLRLSVVRLKPGLILLKIGHSKIFVVLGTRVF